MSKKTSCLQAALTAAAFAMALATAGSVSAKLNWRPVDADDERVIFKAEDLGLGRFVRTFTQRMTLDSTIEVGTWRSATAEARISLQVTGHNVALYHIDPGEHASKWFKKALDWGPKESIKNQLGHVSYRLARDGSRSCIAFAVMYGFMEGSNEPTNGLAGYYCTKSELRPQRVIECLGDTEQPARLTPGGDRRLLFLYADKTVPRKSRNGGRFMPSKYPDPTTVDRSSSPLPKRQARSWLGGRFVAADPRARLRRLRSAGHRPVVVATFSLPVSHIERCLGFRHAPRRQT